MFVFLFVLKRSDFVFMALFNLGRIGAFHAPDEFGWCVHEIHVPAISFFFLHITLDGGIKALIFALHPSADSLMIV